ncbi:hypothetical protein U9M48_030753 [Paspalum notatum var. saurae]|uniref:Uncharacterized protein n=1 Tax=Paspalum notatum var. saurae TaxID=547442 RepID=A0AAQ3U184_PASNO
MDAVSSSCLPISEREASLRGPSAAWDAAHLGARSWIKALSAAASPPPRSFAHRFREAHLSGGVQQECRSTTPASFDWRCCLRGLQLGRTLGVSFAGRAGWPCRDWWPLVMPPVPMAATSHLRAALVTTPRTSGAPRVASQVAAMGVGETAIVVVVQDSGQPAPASPMSPPPPSETIDTTIQKTEARVAPPKIAEPTDDGGAPAGSG